MKNYKDKHKTLPELLGEILGQGKWFDNDNPGEIEHQDGRKTLPEHIKELLIQRGWFDTKEEE